MADHSPPRTQDLAEPAPTAARPRGMAQAPRAAAVPRLARLTRLDAALGALVFGGALALYVRTLAPGLLYSDGGEFQALAVTLGLAHPTGYPVYLLLGKLFTLLPLGSYAYRVNLLSAAAAALTLALLYLLARRLGCRPLAALAGPLGLGLAGLFWWHAVMAEIYTVTTALLAALLLLVLQWRHTGARRALFAAGLLGGLSLGVHGTVMLAAPGVLLYLLLTARRPAAWVSAAAGAGAGVVLALAAFVLLDARDAAVSYVNTTARPWLVLWDLTPADFASPFERIAFLLSGRQFQWAMQPAGAAFPERLDDYWAWAREQWPLPALALMPLGLAACLWPRRGAQRATWREGLLLLGVWIATLAFALSYNVYDVYVFYIPTYVPLAALLARGAEALCAAAERLPRWGGHAYAPALVGAAALLAVAWPTLPAARDSLDAGRITFLDGTEYDDYPYPVRAPDAPHERAQYIADRIEDDALVYTDWGTTFALYYVTYIEQGRRGVTVREWFDPKDRWDIRDALIADLDDIIGSRPIYFTHVPPSLAGRYDFEPASPGAWVFRLLPR